MTVDDFEAMPVITLAELERITRIHRRRLRRLLEADGVRVARSGNRHVVHRAALRRGMPDFYEGVLDCLAIRAVSGRR